MFEQERMNTKAGPFHKYCLSCNECKTNLDASTFLRYPIMLCRSFCPLPSQTEIQGAFPVTIDIVHHAVFVNVTIQVVPKVLLASNQKLRFSICS